MATNQAEVARSISDRLVGLAPQVREADLDNRLGLPRLCARISRRSATE